MRRVPVQRRSRERVELMLEAAAQLLAQGGVEALTTRSLAQHAGIPVATIYRYFDNRDAIIAAYLDHELEEIEASARAALNALERVTFRSAVEAIALAHMRHHQTHPEGVAVWFGGRTNAAVVEQVRALDARMAASLRAAMKGTGMTVEMPAFIAELSVRLTDRMFEFVFLAPRTAAEQEQIVRAFVDIMASYIERFVTPDGHEGISPQEFVSAMRADPALAEHTP